MTGEQWETLKTKALIRSLQPGCQNVVAKLVQKNEFGCWIVILQENGLAIKSATLTQSPEIWAVVRN